MLKNVQFHKYRVSCMKLLQHFLIDSYNKKVPDLNNDVTDLEHNDDTCSFGIIKSSEVTQ